MADLNVNFYYQDVVKSGKVVDEPTLFSPGMVITGTLTGLTPDQAAWLKGKGQDCEFIRLVADPQQICNPVPITDQVRQTSLEERLSWMEKRLERLERK